MEIHRRLWNLGNAPFLVILLPNEIRVYTGFDFSLENEKKGLVKKIEKIVDLTGSASTITYRPLPQDDPVRRRPDISRARDILSWEPQVKLEQGLSQTIAYFHALLSETGLAAVLDHRRSPARGQGAPAMTGSRVAQGR